ncbi:MAG: MAPEG family protein [Allosphingosinicella sp.]
MTRDQKIVAVGAASGVAAMGLAMWLLTANLPPPADPESIAGRLGYALPWLALAALPLFAMIAAIGNARFLGEAIDPTRGAEDKAMVINGRVAENTLQQFALFLAGSLALAATLPAGQVQAVGAAAIWFVVARTAFWIGYRIDPLYRAFGFSSTAYLNLGLLLSALWFALA